MQCVWLDMKKFYLVYSQHSTAYTHSYWLASIIKLVFLTLKNCFKLTSLQACLVNNFTFAFSQKNLCDGMEFRITCTLLTKLIMYSSDQKWIGKNHIEKHFWNIRSCLRDRVHLVSYKRYCIFEWSRPYLPTYYSIL